MEEGFLADHSHDMVLPSQWIGGEPEKNFWGWFKMRGKVKIQIATYRCNRCGYLESYAK
jgi:hypothetical protein